MSLEINTDDDRAQITRTLGRAVDAEQLRTSSTRRKRLEQSSQRRTREWDLNLDIDPEHQTAHTDMNQDPPEIVVTGRELPQPVTDLDRENYDWLAQRALGWHEDGHVLYTDHDSFEDLLSNISQGNQGAAKQLWNVLEDGAIEKALAGEWSRSYDVLRTFRANMFDDMEPGMRDIERGGNIVPVLQATSAVLMDEWMNNVYDLSTDILSLLLADDMSYHFGCDDDRETFENDILPEIRAVVPDVLSEPDPVARNERIFEFIEVVLNTLDDVRDDGRAPANVDDEESVEGIPDDAESSTGQPKGEVPDELEDTDPGDIQKVTVKPGDVDSDESLDVEIPDDVEVEIAEEVSQQKVEESDASGDILDEIEELQSAIQSGSGGLDNDSLLLPEGEGTSRPSVVQEARDASHTLAQLLKQRLQSERESDVRHGTRRGRFTGRGGATARAHRGVKRVKQQKVEPDEKDYSFGMILDRSGSMGRSEMESAEVALGTLVMALEQVGVDVMVIELYNTEARLAKPFGAPWKQYKDELFHGRTGGTTPLSDAVDLARSRLLKEENAYLTVVTDGKPNDSDKFERVIRETPIPTIGVSLTSGDPAGMDDYDRAVSASSGADLEQSLRDLVTEAMF